jgi:type III restriction enzyme
MCFKGSYGLRQNYNGRDWLEMLASERLDTSYSFIWISGNNLHKQSKEKLEKYLSLSRYTLSYLEDIQEGKFKENEIVFVNWHSLVKKDKKTGEFNNVFMRENESDRNLHSFVDRTKEEGREIILIVDESITLLGNQLKSSAICYTP